MYGLHFEENKQTETYLSRFAFHVCAFLILRSSRSNFWVLLKANASCAYFLSRRRSFCQWFFWKTAAPREIGRGKINELCMWSDFFKLQSAKFKLQRFESVSQNIFVSLMLMQNLANSKLELGENFVSGLKSRERFARDLRTLKFKRREPFELTQRWANTRSARQRKRWIHEHLTLHMPLLHPPTAFVLLSTV